MGSTDITESTSKSNNGFRQQVHRRRVWKGLQQQQPAVREQGGPVLWWFHGQAQRHGWWWSEGREERGYSRQGRRLCSGERARPGSAVQRECRRAGQDEAISDYIRGQYKNTTGTDFPIEDKDKKYGV